MRNPNSKSFQAGTKRSDLRSDTVINTFVWSTLLCDVYCRWNFFYILYACECLRTIAWMYVSFCLNRRVNKYIIHVHYFKITLRFDFFKHYLKNAKSVYENKQTDEAIKFSLFIALCVVCANTKTNRHKIWCSGKIHRKQRCLDLSLSRYKKDKDIIDNTNNMILVNE